MGSKAVKRLVGAALRMLDGHGPRCRCSKCLAGDELVEVLDVVVETASDGGKAASKALTEAGGVGGILGRAKAKVSPQGPAGPRVEVTIDGRPAPADLVGKKG